MSEIGYMDRIDTEDYSRLLQLSLDTAPAVLAAFVDSNILPRYKNSFVFFLEHYRHYLFHKWSSPIDCCHCVEERFCVTKAMDSEVFLKLFESDKTMRNMSHVRETSQRIIQECICQFRPKHSQVDTLDITTITFILRECRELRPYQLNFLTKLQEQRIKICNLPRTFVLTYSEYENIWKTLEHVIKEFAGQVGPKKHYLLSVEREIKNLKSRSFARDQSEALHCRLSEFETTINSKISKLMGEVQEKENSQEQRLRSMFTEFTAVLLENYGKVISQTNININVQESENVQIKCTADLPKNWSEQDISERLTNISENQRKENDPFRIVDSEEKCITIHLEMKKVIFTKSSELHNAIRSLLRMICEAGQIDINRPAFVFLQMESYKKGMPDTKQHSLKPSLFLASAQPKPDMKEPVQSPVVLETGIQTLETIQTKSTHGQKTLESDFLPKPTSRPLAVDEQNDDILPTIGHMVQIVQNIFTDIVREWILLESKMTEGQIKTQMYRYKKFPRIRKFLKTGCSLGDCELIVLRQIIERIDSIEKPFQGWSGIPCDRDKNLSGDILKIFNLSEDVLYRKNSSVKEDERTLFLTEANEIVRLFDAYFEKKFDETFEGRFDYLWNYWTYADYIYRGLDIFSLSFPFQIHRSAEMYQRRRSIGSITTFSSLRSKDSGHDSEFSTEEEKEERMVLPTRRSGRPSLSQTLPNTR